MLRRLLIAAAVCVAAGVLGRPADAARPGGWVHTTTSAHFLVHYTSDPFDLAYATETEASDLAALAERARTAELGWGYPAPLDDGDGKIDIYIQDLSALGVLAYTQPDTNTTATTGYIVFGVAELGAPDEGETIAHELFHLIQFATWATASPSDWWLDEASAEWAAAKVYNFPADLAAAAGRSEVSVNCRDSIAGLQMCDADPYIDYGYGRWPFIQSLAERYGANFIQSVLANGAAGMGATDALAAAISAKGGNLGDVYNDWAVQQMDGGYGITSLDALEPDAYAEIQTGLSSTDLTPVAVSVDHLATRYVEFTRGDGAADHPCFAATLTVTVTIPSGVTSHPFLFWNQHGSTPVQLSISGSTATATIPWDTCAWAANAAYLALPNDTTGIDVADFVVKSSLSVDPNVPASATAPPSQGTIYGGQANVSNAEVAPTIALFGPLLLKVPASATQLRLIVESTDVGEVHAILGGVDLGTPSVRAGNNDLRFQLPKSLLSSLRRSSAAGGNLLSLTPLSSSGGTAGEPVTRQVLLAPVTKKKKR